MDTTNRGQPQTSTDWSLLCTFSAVMVVLVFFQLDVTFILQTVFRGLLILGLATFFLHLFGNKLEAFWKWLSHRQEYDRKSSVLSAEDLATQQRTVRERIQTDYQEKAAKHETEVVRPRQEAKKVQLEKEFYKFAGPAWKGKSCRLGEIVLPDEPDATEKECITVAMRTLQSTVKKRKFLYTEKVQVLFDWMTKQGYHPKLYTVCSAFPRRDLSQHVDETLEDIQIVRDVMVVIEERDG